MKRSAALLLLLLGACNQHQVMLEIQAPATRAQEPAGYERATVIRVVDGDTIEVEIDEVVVGPGAGETQAGQTYKLRLTGIDTPESVKPGHPVECFAREASAATKTLLQAQKSPWSKMSRTLIGTTGSCDTSMSVRRWPTLD